MCLEGKEFWQQCVFSTVPSEWFISPILVPPCCLNSGRFKGSMRCCISVFLHLQRKHSLCNRSPKPISPIWLIFIFLILKYDTFSFFFPSLQTLPYILLAHFQTHGFSFTICDYTYIRQIHSAGILISYFRHLELWEAKTSHPRNLDCGPLSLRPKLTKVPLVSQVHCVNKFSIQYNSNQHLGKWLLTPALLGAIVISLNVTNDPRLCVWGSAPLWSVFFLFLVMWCSHCFFLLFPTLLYSSFPGYMTMSPP